jgi:hypothetical protein
MEYEESCDDSSEYARQHESSHYEISYPYISHNNIIVIGGPQDSPYQIVRGGKNEDTRG